MSTETYRVLVGDCSVTFADDSETAGDGRRSERGQLLVVEKPDGTVLVHDRDGYRPVAWLTRAEAVAWERTGAAPTLSAVEGDRRLEVVCHGAAADGRYPASAAGTPVGQCPDCGSSLLRTTDAVTCLDCDARYGIPRDADVADGTCEACALPLMVVERGASFEVCVDRHCESLDDAVRARFDRAWSCPSCERDLRVVRRGGLLAGCDGYPDCDVAFALPAGTVDDECGDCGLPVFETPSGPRCLDATCSERQQGRT